MTIPRQWDDWSGDQKYEYVLRVAQSRRDARAAGTKPKTRGGRKPTDINERNQQCWEPNYACGKVCKPKDACKSKKGAASPRSSPSPSGGVTVDQVIVAKKRKQLESSTLEPPVPPPPPPKPPVAPKPPIAAKPPVPPPPPPKPPVAPKPPVPPPPPPKPPVAPKPKKQSILGSLKESLLDAYRGAKITSSAALSVFNAVKKSRGGIKDALGAAKKSLIKAHKDGDVSAKTAKSLFGSLKSAIKGARKPVSKPPVPPPPPPKPPDSPGTPAQRKQSGSRLRRVKTHQSAISKGKSVIGEDFDLLTTPIESDVDIADLRNQADKYKTIIEETKGRVKMLEDMGGRDRALEDIDSEYDRVQAEWEKPSPEMEKTVAEIDRLSAGFDGLDPESREYEDLSAKVLPLYSKLRQLHKDKGVPPPRLDELNRLRTQVIEASWAKSNHDDAVQKMEEVSAQIDKYEKEHTDIIAKQEAAAERLIQKLIENSDISPEQAKGLADLIEIDDRMPRSARKQVESLIRLTNGQCMETLKKIEFSEDRACASKYGGFVRWDGKDAHALFHEVGHHVEFASQNFNGVIGQGWVKSRATGNPEKLRVITGALYDDDEIAYPDHFATPYVGKIYEDNSTEVISVGLEAFADSKRLANLARTDPEHFALVVGVLQQGIDLSRQLPKMPLRYQGKNARKDSLLAGDYFGLNPNPFHKPLWDVMYTLDH